TSIILFLLHQFFVSKLWPWTYIFLGCCAVMLPFLFWFEARSAGDFLGQAVRGQPRPGSLAELNAPVSILDVVALSATGTAPNRSAIILFEFFLIGPRLLLGARRQLRISRRFKSARLDRAAQVLEHLMQRKMAYELPALLR